MDPAGPTPDLLWAAAWIFLAGTWIVSRHLPLRWAAPLVAARVLVPVAYFYFNSGGALQLVDDQWYFHTTVRLLQLGYDPVSIFMDPWGLPFFHRLTGSWQVGYNYWNLTAMWLFGPYYFSPVLLNVGATFVAGWFFFRILGSMGFSRNYCRAALVFFLLHWDVIAWSSFLNMKDILVMTFTLAALHEAIRFFRKPSPTSGAGFIAALAVLVFLRFYIPLVLLLAIFAFLLERERSLTRSFALLILVAGAAVLFARRFEVGAMLQRYVTPSEIPWGIPHFLLTPLPWKLSPGYRFLELSAWLWLAFVIPALAMIPLLWKRHPHARLLLTYLILIGLLYAGAPDFRGPRHRVQITFLLVWLEFHALWLFLMRLLKAVQPRGSTVSRSAGPPG